MTSIKKPKITNPIPQKLAKIAKIKFKKIYPEKSNSSKFKTILN